jgi:hypothetical protein
MRRDLTLLVPGLLLVCCEKPASSNKRAVDSAPARRTARDGDGRPATTRLPDTPETLRKRLEAAAGIESSEGRFKAIAAVEWNTFEMDPDLASEAFLKLPEENPERIRLIQHYAIRLAEQNHEETIVWANALGSDLESATALCQIALTLAETDTQAIRDAWLQHADAGIESEIEQQREKALETVGDNIPKPWS